MASDLLARRMLSSLAGLTFQGARDLYEVLGYKKVLTYDDLYAKYQRQDIARRLVDEPVKAIWSHPPTISLRPHRDSNDDEAARDTEQEDAFNQEFSLIREKFDLWSLMARIDKLNAFGTYSGLIIGAPGNSADPLRNITADRIVYMQPYGSNELQIDTWDQDPASPRFGLPKTYRLTRIVPAKASGVVAPAGVIFHYTRVIHFTNELLVSNCLSSPRLESVYNLLDDLLKVAGGSAETYWLTANRGMQMDVDKEMDLSEDDATALSDEMEEFQHQLRRFVRTRGVTIKNLGSDVADPSSAFKVIINLISGATGIPQRILLGAEAGQLASEQDRANWAMQVRLRRTDFAEPYILRPLIMHLSSIGVLRSINIGADTLTFTWPDAFQMSPLERAQTMAQSARAIVNISRQAQMGHPLVTTQEARAILGLPKDADIALPSPLDSMEYLNKQKAPQNMDEGVEEDEEIGEDEEDEENEEDDQDNS